MTSQSPRIYLYKITFEEVPYYYYGVHKEKYFNEEYWGSPITNKWCWELYIPKKQILEIFSYDEEGWDNAVRVEKRLIMPFFNTDKWCLNESCGTLISLKVMRENGKKVGNLYGSINGKLNKEAKKGIFSLSAKEKSDVGKKGGETNKRNKTGVCGLSLEDRIKYGKMGAKVSEETKTGIYALTAEQLSENAKKTNSQRWICLETGFITSPAALGRYQKAKGIDTSKRKRIS